MRNQISKSKIKESDSLNIFAIAGECYNTFKLDFRAAGFIPCDHHRMYVRQVPQLTAESNSDLLHFIINRRSHLSRDAKLRFFPRESFLVLEDVQRQLSLLGSELNQELICNQRTFSTYTKAMIIPIELMTAVYRACIDQRDFSLVKKELIQFVGSYILAYAENELLSSSRKHIKDLEDILIAINSMDARPLLNPLQHAACLFLMRLNELYIELLCGEHAVHAYYAPTLKDLKLDYLRDSIDLLPVYSFRSDRTKHKGYLFSDVVHQYGLFSESAAQVFADFNHKFHHYCAIANRLFELISNTQSHIAQGDQQLKDDAWLALVNLDRSFKLIDSQKKTEDFEALRESPLYKAISFLHEDQNLKTLLADFIQKYELSKNAVV